jgi:hypothetical protein
MPQHTHILPCLHDKQTAAATLWAVVFAAVATALQVPDKSLLAIAYARPYLRATGHQGPSSAYIVCCSTDCVPSSAWLLDAGPFISPKFKGDHRTALTLTATFHWTRCGVGGLVCRFRCTTIAHSSLLPGSHIAVYEQQATTGAQGPQQLRQVVVPFF